MITGFGDLQTFRLVRDVDESGISGTGVVARGVVFTDGTVAMRWITANRSTALYDSMLDLLKIHGHGGKTRVEYDVRESEDDRPCARCGHLFAQHVHDGAGCCDIARCDCNTLNHHDKGAVPLGPSHDERVAAARRRFETRTGEYAR